MVKNVRFSNGLPYHVITSFENQASKVSEKLNLRISGVGIPMVTAFEWYKCCQNVKFSNGYSNHLKSGIQMIVVTILKPDWYSNGRLFEF